MNATLGNIPKHVAIVMDGNGRWAESRQLPRFKGHQAGVEAVRDIIKGSIEVGVEVLTLFAFSTENWSRPEEEVNFLFNLFVQSIHAELPSMHEQNVRICFIGARDKFNPDLIEALEKAEKMTANNTRLVVNVAADYGGRWDVIQACQKVARLVETKQLTSSDVTEAVFSEQLSLAHVPSPDLFIRTSGEIRLSNFLLWDLAYSELYFSDLLWPDFNKAAFKEAVNAYALRKRRYGLTEQQRTDLNG